MFQVIIKRLPFCHAFGRVKSTEMFNMTRSQNAEQRSVAIMDIITI